MARRAGRGIGPTLGRDLVFGGIFTLLRKDFAARVVPANSEGGASATAARFACDVAAAAVATTASAPFNYARNILYAAPAGARLSTAAVLVELFAQAAQQGSPLASLFFLQRRLKIGTRPEPFSFSPSLGPSSRP
jgi:hypothetical protein